jgi:protoporphyrinogen oxidase
VPAVDWLEHACGPAAVRELWGPLLHAKFGSAAEQVPAAWMWGRFEQRRGARKGAGEKLGYLRGGFRQIFDRLAERLDALGVDVLTSTRVGSVLTRDGRASGVSTNSGDVDADAVLFTGGLPGIGKLVPAEYVDQRWVDAEGMSVICSVIETDRPITDVYWTNVCDDGLGFGAIIEQTNLVPPSDYAGRHVTYLGRYFTKDEPIAQADPAAETDTWLDQLAATLPSFDRSSVLGVHPFRAPYAAPLVTLGYRARIPDMRTPLTGLYLATTAQIYPADRGMSEGVRMGTTVAQLIVGDRLASGAAR